MDKNISMDLEMISNSVSKFFYNECFPIELKHACAKWFDQQQDIVYYDDIERAQKSMHALTEEINNYIRSNNDLSLQSIINEYANRNPFALYHHIMIKLWDERMYTFSNTISTLKKNCDLEKFARKMENINNEQALLCNSIEDSFIANQDFRNNMELLDEKYSQVIMNFSIVKDLLLQQFTWKLTKLCNKNQERLEVQNLENQKLFYNQFMSYLCRQLWLSAEMSHCNRMAKCVNELYAKNGRKIQKLFHDSISSGLIIVYQPPQVLQVDKK